MRRTAPVLWPIFLVFAVVVGGRYLGADAQDDGATPSALFASPEAPGCEGMATYATAMLALDEATGDDPRLDLMAGDGEALLDVPAEDFGPAADALDEFVTQMDEVEPAPVALDWHEDTLRGLRLFRDVFRAVGNGSSIIVELLARSDAIDALDQEIADDIARASSACATFPEFYAAWDDEDEGTPTASSIASPVASLPAGMATPTGAAAVTLSGSGQTGTDAFDLSGGLYRFTAECGAGYFSLEVLPVVGDEYVSASLYGQAPFNGSSNVRLDGGRYALTVACDGRWTVTVEPVQ